MKLASRAAITAAIFFLSAFSANTQTSRLTLEHSTDLQEWESVAVTPEMLDLSGDILVPYRGPTGFYRLRVLVENGTAEPRMLDVQGGTLETSNELDGTKIAAFQLGSYEVTWGEWKAVRAQADAQGYDIDGVGAGCADDHPVHSVNWYDVVKWCNLKSEIEGLTPVYTVNGEVYREGEFGWSGSHVVQQDLSADGYRLPLEAEWEFAARGGIQTNGFTYSGSDDLDEVGWYHSNSAEAACDFLDDRGTWPVGQKDANELGLHDMSGNVWEWCWDASGTDRRRRGGGWYSDANQCTASNRGNFDPELRSERNGFRLARNLAP